MAHEHSSIGLFVRAFMTLLDTAISHLTETEAAILRTLLYADIFHFALNRDELYYYLLHHRPIPRREIEATLVGSAALQRLLCHANGYVALHTAPDNIARRIEREALTRRLMPTAEQYGRWLARLPFVQMVALTGALAARNPFSPSDDYDYMLVTQPGRVWLARAFAIGLVRLARLRGQHICPNYVVAADNLVQTRQDVYIAREIAQTQPLYGYALYQTFREVNAWTAQHLPHATHGSAINPAPANRLKRSLEWLLGGQLGDWLEMWEYRRKAARFQQQAAQGESAAEINDRSVKGHFDDHGSPILRQYSERLAQYGLAGSG